MDQQRADLGFGEALDAFDPAAWVPQAPIAHDNKPPKAETARVAVAAGFLSREPQLPPEPVIDRRALRGRRTGRNAQLNLKATPETIAAFCAIADNHGWGLCETLEHAVALLEREFPVITDGVDRERG